MKIKETNARKYNQTSQQTENFITDKDIETLIEENVQSVARKSFIQSSPLATTIAAAALVGAPIVGMAVTGAPAQAADLTETMTNATYADANEDMSVFSEDVQNITKTARFTVSGPGHIEALDNCTIDNATGTIIFNSADSNATFKVVGSTATAQHTAYINGVELPGGTDEITLEASTVSTAQISISFSDPEGERLERERIEAEKARAAQEAEQARIAQEAAAAAQQNNNPAPAKKAKQNAAPAKTAAPARAAAAPVNATPNSGAAQHAMNGEEMAQARAIFDSYNAYRASKGLAPAVWSDDCANMAYGSSTGCAAKEDLIHRLGIPAGVQRNYSDILQFSTWKMTAQEAVKQWSKSPGHRKMMQCTTTTIAGVGVYNNNGVWYYSIVYNFVGHNQNGE